MYVQWVRVGKGYGEAQRHYQAGLEAQKRGDYAGSARELALAAKHAPDDANSHLRLAAAYHRLNQPLQAVQAQERALSLSPPNEAASLQLLANYCKMGRYDDAKRVLTRDVAPRWPSSAETAYYQGIVHFYGDKGPQGMLAAEACFARSLAIDSHNTSARYQRAACLSRMGRPAEAESEYREVLKAFSNDAATLAGLATALRQQGKTAEAQRMMAKFQNLDAIRRRIMFLRTRTTVDGERPDPLHLRELGDLYMQVDEPDKAVPAYTRYLRFEPTEVRSLRRLADAYRKLQRPDDETATLKLADALDARQTKVR